MAIRYGQIFSRVLRKTGRNLSNQSRSTLQLSEIIACKIILGVFGEEGLVCTAVHETIHKLQIVVKIMLKLKII